MHWVIHKVLRAIPKRKDHSLSFPEYLKYTKRKSNKTVDIFFGGEALENYCTPDYPSLLSYVGTFASFLRITLTSLRAFPPSSCFTTLQIVFFLDWSFSRLQHPWIWFDSFPVWCRLRPYWVTTSNREVEVYTNNTTDNAFPCETLLAIEWTKHSSFTF